jgi:NitT/TauT family transport system permease protein
MKVNIRSVLRGTAVVVFWLAVWWLAAVAVRQELLLPTPLAVLQTLGELMFTSSFWKAVFLSLLRIAAGFAAAVVGGTVLAVLCHLFPVLRVLFSPLMHIVRAAPVASFIILTLVWVYVEAVPIVISFLMVLPIVFINVQEGICRTDTALLEMAKAYRLPFSRTVKAIYLPSVKPFFMIACVNGLGFAWKSGIAAEVICRPDFSIGRQLQSAKLLLETPEVFAWTAVVVVLSLLFEKALLAVTKKGGILHDNT